MGCGCRNRGGTSRTKTFRPATGPQSSKGGVAAGATPAQLRAIGLVQSVTISQSTKMNEQRRRIEKLRREAIKKRLNK